MTSSFTDVVLVPGLLMFFAAFLLIGSYTNPSRNTQWPRRFGILLLGLAFLASLRPFWDAANPATGYIYRASILSRKTLYAHYATPVVALAALIGSLFYERVHNRRHGQEY